MFWLVRLLLLLLLHTDILLAQKGKIKGKAFKNKDGNGRTRGCYYMSCHTESILHCVLCSAERNHLGKGRRRKRADIMTRLSSFPSHPSTKKKKKSHHILIES